MGCDVTVDEMLAFTPTKMLGASGYVMAINANGYVMFHPNLKAQVSRVLFAFCTAISLLIFKVDQTEGFYYIY